MKKKLLVVGCWLLVAVVAAVFVLVRNKAVDNENGRGERPRSSAIEEQGANTSLEDCGRAGRTTLPDSESVTEPDPEVEDVPTPAEIAEQEEERLVEAFDALTDKWEEPSSKGVTMADVDAFARQFAALPKDRREECLQRALNLVPDENALLLAGIVTDKSMDRELVELVFNDLLNRDDAVKLPILREILKDKAHPCWKDAAWILDEPVGEDAS